MPNLQGGVMQSSNMVPKGSNSPIGRLDHIGSQIIGEHRRNTQEQMITSMSPARQHESSLAYPSPGRTSAKEL